MAKRKPPRGPKSADTAAITRDKRHQATPIAHPLPLPSLRRRVAQAHAKHTIPQQSERPTLADRFNNLPPELRAYIFSLVLVRPIRWDLPHQPDCPLLTTNTKLSPAFDLHNYNCVRHEFFNYYTPAAWRCSRQQESWRNPWRSKWAPDVTNPYVCSDCWDDELRLAPHPTTHKEIPCLCARRGNLEVLLVCKQWYAEASRVLWSRNTFAFESPTAFVDFTDGLSARCREMIGRASIMAEPPQASEGDPTTSEWTGTNRRIDARMWSRLRLLPALSYLELDAVFLTRQDTVQAMLHLGLRNLRQVNFVFPSLNLENTENGSRWIWPRFHEPTLLAGGLAEEVARAIKGQRRGWMRRKGLLRACVEGEMEARKVADYAASKHGTGKHDADCYDTWRNLSRADVGSHPAYLPNGRYVRREGHWRGWKPMSGGGLMV